MKMLDDFCMNRGFFFLVEGIFEMYRMCFSR